MPYPNYHAARIRDPGDFVRIAVLKTTSDGIMIYGGPLKGKPGGGSTAQSYRFPKSKYSASQARNWLKTHDIKYTTFEKASGGTEAVESFIEESCVFENARVETEGDQTIIRDVVLLGAESKNKRTYTPEAMSGAVSLYEGCKCYINHDTYSETMTGRRSVQNLAGRFRSVRYDESQNKLKADLFPVMSMEGGKILVNVANDAPDIAGFSHRAAGIITKDNGREVVEKIKRVLSVDLVAEPATTQGMFEDIESERNNEMEWEDISPKELKKHRHDIYEDILAEGVKSRDDEVKKLTEEKTQVEKQLDEMKVTNTLREKEASVDKLLSESELPKEAVTDLFRKMCHEAKPEEKQTFEEAVQLLIEDRKGALKLTGVRNMGSEKDLTSRKKGDVDEEKVDEALEV